MSVGVCVGVCVPLPSLPSTTITTTHPKPVVIPFGYLWAFGPVVIPFGYLWAFGPVVIPVDVVGFGRVVQYHPFPEVALKQNHESGRCPANVRPECRL